MAAPQMTGVPQAQMNLSTVSCHNPSYAQIGADFAAFYYKCFAADRASVEQCYHENALFQFEDDMKMGKPAIGEKIRELPFSKVAHEITKIDSQPLGDGSILVMVTGMLKADDDKPLGFSHVFVLVSHKGSFFIMHEIFRLALHNVPVQ